MKNSDFIHPHFKVKQQIWFSDSISWYLVIANELSVTLAVNHYQTVLFEITTWQVYHLKDNITKSWAKR